MSCELTQEQRDAQNKIVEVAWKALKNTGLDPGDWMLMEWRRTGDSWNGDTLFHFKNVNTRLYIFIPSKWAGVEPIERMIGDQPETDPLLEAAAVVVANDAAGMSADVQKLAIDRLRGVIEDMEL